MLRRNPTPHFFVCPLSSLPLMKKEEASLPLWSPKKKKRKGASKSWMPQTPHAYPLFFSSFLRFYCWFLCIKERFLCWFYSKKIKKKSSSQREKDKEEDGSSFLCAALKKEFFFQIFFIFFKIKIILNLIFNIKI